MARFLVLIPITPMSQLDFGTVQDALRRINYTDYNDLPFALNQISNRVNLFF